MKNRPGVGRKNSFLQSRNEIWATEDPAAGAPFLSDVPHWQDEAEQVTESKSRTRVAQFIQWISMRRHVDYANFY